jgi:hypothetical protein
MTSRLLLPGPLVGDALMDLWPRLKAHVQAAISRQDRDVAHLMVTILEADASQLAFTISDTADEIVVSISGRPFCGVPLASLADDGSQAH